MSDQYLSNPNPSSPFHPGEHAAQLKVGMRDKLEEIGKRFIRPYFLDQHQAFFSQLPFAIVSACDENGLVWVSMLVAKQGFISFVDNQHLNFAAKPIKGDAIENTLVTGAQVGLIGIELHSRRRNRANGVISQVSDDAISFKVSQSYGNCPQYISPRNWQYKSATQAPNVEHHQTLTTAMQTWISESDTLFIGSNCAIDSQQIGSMDASHRGGEPGFVKVAANNELILPDYRGNNFFNTIGNLMVNPKVGLLFIDFETGSLLQISGRAELDWDSEEIAEYAGAQRLIRIQVDQIVLLENVVPLSWL